MICLANTADQSIITSSGNTPAKNPAANSQSWVGDLKDSQSVADTGLTLGFSDAGILTSGGSYATCVLALQLTPQSVSSNPYYAASLQISGDTTTCGRVARNGGNALSMTGIGLIHASPVVGKTKRLELILTDTTGSGISFRGDQ